MEGRIEDKGKIQDLKLKGKRKRDETDDTALYVFFLCSFRREKLTNANRNTNRKRKEALLGYILTFI